MSEAEKLYESALNTRMKLLGHDSAEVAETLQDQQDMLRQQGRFAEGEKVSREALALRQKLFGPNDPRVFDSIFALAQMLAAKGSYDEAMQRYEEALAFSERISGPDSLEVATVLTTMADVIENQKGDFARAEELLQRSLDIRRRRLEPNDLRIDEAVGNLGALRYLQGRYEDAEKLYRQAYEHLVQVVGKDSSNTIISEENLAAALMSLERFDEALDLMKDVIERRAAVLGANSPKVARSMVNRAAVLSTAGRAEEAVTQYQDAVARFAQAYGENHPEYAVVLRMYASALAKAGQSARAEAMAREALARFEANKLPADHSYVGQAHVTLANALIQQGKLDEAQAQLDAARPVFVKAGLDNGFGRYLVQYYGDLYKRRGKPKTAEAIKAELVAAEK
jgi:tetratricopeptide (TPR) repeat protein